MSSATLKCPECPYDKLRNLGTHLFFVHGYSKHRITHWRMSVKTETLSRYRDADGNTAIFTCKFCPKTYKRQNSCRAHERVVHCVTSSMRQKRVPCPVKNCRFVTTALLDLCAHAKESHSEMGDYSIREARFENMTLFQAWRMEYEDRTQSVLATESVNSNAAAGTTLRYLRCAQLEAQVRKARNEMKQRVETNGGESDKEIQMEDEVEEDSGEEEEETAPPPPPPSVPSRPVRKRKMTARLEEYCMKEEEKGFGSVAKKEKEEETDDEEEEEIDVEQLDDVDDLPLPSSSLTPSIPLEPIIPKKKLECIPRLMRASSAHLAQDEYEFEENEESPQPNSDELNKRIKSRHCTAHMRVLVLQSGAVHVEYCNSHLGHDLIPVPPFSRCTEPRVERKKHNQSLFSANKSVWQREADEEIEKAKQRRKGRRETEHRWKNENRMKTERDQFDKLCNSYEDIGANVELYEAAEDGAYEEDELQVEEVIEEDEVVHQHQPIARQ